MRSHSGFNREEGEDSVRGRRGQAGAGSRGLSRPGLKSRATHGRPSGTSLITPTPLSQPPPGLTGERGSNRAQGCLSPSSPVRWEGGGEKRAGVMRASNSWRGRAQRAKSSRFGKVVQLRSPSPRKWPRSGEGARGTPTRRFRPIIGYAGSSSASAPPAAAPCERGRTVAGGHAAALGRDGHHRTARRRFPAGRRQSREIRILVRERGDRASCFFYGGERERAT